MKKFIFYICIITFLTSCSQRSNLHQTVLCIPVYGQSLALGEEAERITDFDSLANYADGRIVTENLDHQFGYFENDELKEFAKKLVGYQKRAFELSVYNMAKVLADSTGSDTLICIFYQAFQLLLETKLEFRLVLFDTRFVLWGSTRT